MSESEKELGFFKKLRVGLRKTRQSFVQQLQEITQKDRLKQEDLETLEDIMLLNDFGVQATADIMAFLKTKRFDKNEDIRHIQQYLATYLGEKLAEKASDIVLHKKDKLPYIVLLAGVNGSGKTTTVAKIAYKYKQAGYKTLIVAADTFRAAAVEQLAIWAKRIVVEIFTKDSGYDAAALIYEAYAYALENGFHTVIIDTAGRLQNQVNLMSELEKIQRVLNKISTQERQDRYLIIDATTGQNSLSQVDMFHKKLNLNGLIITKMDGSARGGIIVAICQKYNIPIRAICVGEKIDDIVPFNAIAYVEALLDISQKNTGEI